MAFCNQCGTQLADGTTFCSACGASQAAAQQNAAPAQNAYTPGAQAAPALDDAQQNKAMGILAYFSLLVLVPLFAAQNSPFARYHANQGLVLLIGEVAYGILVSILTTVFWAISWTLGSIMSTLFGLLWLVFPVLSIIGIMHAAKGETKPLPIVGGVKILK